MAFGFMTKGPQTTSNTSTAIAVDSYNRTINSSSNMSNSGNVSLAFAAEPKNAFDPSAGNVKLTAIVAAGIVALVLGIGFLLAWLRKKS